MKFKVEPTFDKFDKPADRFFVWVQAAPAGSDMPFPGLPGSWSATAGPFPSEKEAKDAMKKLKEIWK